MRTCHRPCPPRRLRSQRCMRSSRRLGKNSQSQYIIKALQRALFRMCARGRPLARGETVEARVEVRNLIRSDELVLAGRARHTGVVVARSLARGARGHCTRTRRRVRPPAQQRRTDSSSDSARTACRTGTHTCNHIYRNQQRARPHRRHRQNRQSAFGQRFVSSSLFLKGSLK